MGNFKKNLKMLFAIEIFLILLIAALTLIENQEMPTAYAVKEIDDKKVDFKIFTKAVCEDKSEHLFCRDKLFVKCNGEEYSINQRNLSSSIECNGVKLNLSEISVNGNGVFKKNV